MHSLLHRDIQQDFPSILDQIIGACSWYANIGDLPVIRHPKGKPTTKHVANYTRLRTGLCLRVVQAEWGGTETSNEGNEEFRARHKMLLLKN